MRCCYGYVFPRRADDRQRSALRQQCDQWRLCANDRRTDDPSRSVRLMSAGGQVCPPSSIRVSPGQLIGQNTSQCGLCCGPPDGSGEAAGLYAEGSPNPNTRTQDRAYFQYIKGRIDPGGLRFDLSETVGLRFTMTSTGQLHGQNYIKKQPGTHIMIGRIK